MPSQRKRSSKSLAQQSAELAMAVPQVVGHRVTRMALAGGQPSPRDQREFQRMVDEKSAAFAESWQAMGAAALRANQQLALTMWSSCWTPWSKSSATPQAAARRWQQAAMGVLGTGLAPVHRRAVANAKRLKNTRLR